MKRRLVFGTVDDAIQEIHRLRDGGYVPMGKWNLTQICEHLALAMEATLQGGEITMRPWLFRQTIGRIGRYYILQQRRMVSGFEAPRQVLPQACTEDDPRIVERCVQAFRDVQSSPARLPEHPGLGPFTTAEWRVFHLVHAAHHLGYLQPR